MIELIIIQDKRYLFGAVVGFELNGRDYVCGYTITKSPNSVVDHSVFLYSDGNTVTASFTQSGGHTTGEVGYNGMLHSIQGNQRAQEMVNGLNTGNTSYFRVIELIEQQS